MPTGIYQRPSVEFRFWAKVNITPTCWLWTGATYGQGYGQFNVSGSKHGPAHRFSYEAVYGKIPIGKVLDHLCRVLRCVNPAHLEAVSGRENILRGTGVSARNARKTHCLRGHPLSGKNLVIQAIGTRCCRTCRTISSRAYYQRKVLKDKVRCFI